MLFAPIIGHSQTRSDLYYFCPNQTAVKILYNNKNQEIAIQEYSLTSTENQNSVSGQTVKYKNGEITDKMKNIFRKEGNKLLISMGINKNGEYAFLDYPMANHSSEYDIIPKLEFNTETKLVGKWMNVSCKIDDRKIVAFNERITTPIGTWECMKISYDMEIKSFGIPVKVSVIEWFSGKVGIVRTDIFRGGKLQEKRLLTNFKKTTG